MRRLLLLRHAKSDWPEGVRDEERPLGARGRAAAPRMGAYLAREALVPTHTVVSPARRTQETWDLVRGALGRGGHALPEAATDARIYGASTEALLAVIGDQPDRAGTMLLLGHNPGMQDLARHLIGQGDRTDVTRLTAKYPTAALAVLEFPVPHWAEAGLGGARLARYVTPKDLGGVDED